MNELRLQQIPLFTAIVEELTRQAKDQGITLTAIPRQLNAVVDAANAIIKEFQIGAIPSTEAMGLRAWIQSDDTGLSSRAMAARLFPAEYTGQRTNDHPHDPGDFGRCYRFLRAVNGARDLVPQMADASPQWEKLAENWNRLETLYEQELADGTGSAPKLFEAIQSLIR